MKKIYTLVSVMTLLGSSAAHADSLMQGVDFNTVNFNAIVDVIVLGGAALVTFITAFLG